VKGALFSMLESLLATERPGAVGTVEDLEPGDPELWRGLNVADLYAGTGSLGIEALSRGAAWCDFVEKEQGTRGIIERNLQTTGLRDRAKILGLDVKRVVEGAARVSQHLPYGVVLMDPPYRDLSISVIIAALGSDELLDRNALVAVEHSRDVTLAESYEVGDVADGSRLAEVRQRRHGDTVLSIYRWIRPAERGVYDNGNHRDLPG
jgi:16S rRNA (guanine966-N2)-methyltransferase